MKPILLTLILTACIPQPTPAPDLRLGYPTEVEIEGAGAAARVGYLKEESSASSTDLCEASHVYNVFIPSPDRDEQFVLGFRLPEAGLSGPVASETDVIAPNQSHITLPDGRNGVLTSGTVQLIDNGDTLIFTLAGSRWCGLELDPVTGYDVISTCIDEEIEVSYTITITDDRGRLFGCTSEAGYASEDGLCTSPANPPRCFGDPIPAPLY